MKRIKIINKLSGEKLLATKDKWRHNPSYKIDVDSETRTLKWHLSSPSTLIFMIAEDKNLFNLILPNFSRM